MDASLSRRRSTVQIRSGSLMNTVDEIDIAWFTGLFEGEGSFWFSSGKAKGLQMSMTDLDVLTKVHTLFGGSITSANRPDGMDHWKDAWRWHIGLTLSLELVPRMLPYLFSRRSERAKEFLDSARTQREVTKNRKKSVNESRWVIFEMHSTGEYTHQQIADILCKDRSYVSHVLRGRYGYPENMVVVA